MLHAAGDDPGGITTVPLNHDVFLDHTRTAYKLLLQR